jgi:hypothetical protein
MTKKRSLLFASLPLAVAVMLGVLAMLPRPGVPKARFDRIEKGMTKDEVEDLLGEPGFDFPWACVGTFAWRADNGDLEAFTFDRSGRMEWRFHYRKETISEKIFRWLHLDLN